jgi:hypothetical protein
MKKWILLVGVFFLSFMPFLAESQILDPCHYSTEGTDFWLGLMQNRSSGAEHYLEITVTSRLGAQITVTYGPTETLIGNYTVGPNSSIPISIDYKLVEANGSESVENKGIHLKATNSVNVYALNYRTQSSDVAVIYPTESLGKEYFAMCYSPRYTTGNESNSEFLVVASADNTTVKITPSRNTDQGKAANVPFTVTLNKGQSYQVQAGNTDTSGKEDLTGSFVTANKPIAFFSGAKAVTIPVSGFVSASYDHLYEQIPPTATWGKEFYVVPLHSRIKDTYRVLAAEDGTVVRIEANNVTVTLKRGQFHEFELSSSQASRIMSSKKVLLAQYCRSQRADGNSGVGDPFMTILSPISQKINDVTFEAYESDKINSIFFVNIITTTAEVPNMMLDGVNISSHFVPFLNNEYAYAQVPTTKGTHRLWNTDIHSGFLAFIYGFGSSGNTESYGYGVGFNLDIQLDLRSENLSDTVLICYGDEAELDAGSYFDRYLWSTKDTTSGITVSEEGWYKVTGKTTVGCSLTDSVYVAVDRPETSLGKDTTVCLSGEYTIVAEDGFVNYLWQDGSTEKTFTVETTGNYWVTVTNKNGCQVTDTAHVEVRMPVLSFTPDYLVATIDHPDITFTNHTAGAVDFSWDFGDNSPESAEVSPKHHYTDLGIYHVVLTASNEFGCTDTFGMDVKIVPSTFFIPNAFRPDSEISENRTFLPTIVSLDEGNYKLIIYNRVGSALFESGNIASGWDGNLSGRKKAEPGVYVWIVKYKDVQGIDHLQKGTVMLVR